jgi:uncharacterized protein YqgV (UPF0045/DUF77 family)
VQLGDEIEQRGEEMETMAAQVSIYPLRQTSVSDAISEALAAFRATGVEVYPGAMSTVITGNEDAVFVALREGYRVARAKGDVVVFATLSNACPTPATPHGEGAANAKHQPE